MSHGKPEDGMECGVCFDDVTEENYTEFRDGADRPWKKSNLCEPCVEQCKGIIGVVVLEQLSVSWL